VYKSLDNTELTKFLESQALFHTQFQKFGNVKFEKTKNGGRMICSDYPCYSPIFCGSAIGFYLESILRHGGTDPNVVETKCQTLGDSSCTFDMTWK
jgi:predicted hydrocarbon binding protein